MRTTRLAGLALGALALGAFLVIAVSGPTAPPPGRAQADSAEWLRETTDRLIKVEPLIRRLEDMEELIESVRATSPTLEQLEDLQVNAESVTRLNAALARLEKIEPTLVALEALERDAARRSPRTGLGAPKPPKWTDLLETLQERLAAIEKAVYARPGFRDPASARRLPVEQRLRELEKRQESLVKEMQELQDELQRLRRQQRDAL